MTLSRSEYIIRLSSDSSGSLFYFGRGDQQDENMETDCPDALLQHDRCMWEVPLRLLCSVCGKQKRLCRYHRYWLSG